MKKKGFTMIELLVVLAIIAMLVSIALVGLRTARVKARDSRRMSDMNELFKALTLYENSSRTYPIYNGNITGSDAMSVALQNAGTISKTPLDPLADQYYTYQSADGTTFTLGFCLETDIILNYFQGCGNTITP